MRASEVFEATQSSTPEMIYQTSYTIDHDSWYILGTILNQLGIYDLNDYPDLIKLIDDNKNKVLTYCNNAEKQYSKTYFAVNILKLISSLNQVNYYPDWLINYINNDKENIIRSLLAIVKADYNSLDVMNTLKKHLLVMINIFDWPELKIIKRSVDHILNGSTTLNEAYQPSESEIIEKVSSVAAKVLWNLLGFTLKSLKIKNLSKYPNVVKIIEDNRDSILNWCDNSSRQSYDPIGNYAIGPLSLLHTLSAVKYVPRWLIEYFNKNKTKIITSILQIIKRDGNSPSYMKLIRPYTLPAFKILKWPELKTINNSINHIIKTSTPD